MISLILLFFKTPLSNLFHSQIQKKFIFKESNINIWAISPGTLKNPTLVNLTFYHHVPNIGWLICLLIKIINRYKVKKTTTGGSILSH